MHDDGEAALLEAVNRVAEHAVHVILGQLPNRHRHRRHRRHRRLGAALRARTPLAPPYRGGSLRRACPVPPVPWPGGGSSTACLRGGRPASFSSSAAAPHAAASTPPTREHACQPAPGLPPAGPPCAC
eukprot:scaffold28339_cov54-Phaeocystis_antarctica.AAC.2